MSAVSKSVFSGASNAPPPVTKIDSFVVDTELPPLEEYLAALEPEAFARAVAIAADGQGNLSVNIASSTNAVLGVELASQTQVFLSHGHAGAVNAVATHPSMPAYVTASDDHTVLVWALEEEQHRMLAATELTQRPTALAIAPGGSAIAVGLHDGGLLLLDMGDTRDHRAELLGGRRLPRGRRRSRGRDAALCPLRLCKARGARRLARPRGRSGLLCGRQLAPRRERGG